MGLPPRVWGVGSRTRTTRVNSPRSPLGGAAHRIRQGREAAGVQPLRDPIVSEIELGVRCSLQCRVRVPYDLAIFDGHFPAIPIVPGVA